MVEVKAAFFREKAVQCRRLADTVINRDDPAVSALIKMADEFETNAAAMDAAQKHR